MTRGESLLVDGHVHLHECFTWDAFLDAAAANFAAARRALQLASGSAGCLMMTERDAESLARAIEELVGAPDTWAAIGQAGRARVEQQHDINRLNGELVRVYEGLVGASASRSAVAG